MWNTNVWNKCCQTAFDGNVFYYSRWEDLRYISSNYIGWWSVYFPSNMMNQTCR